ncbi:MAG: hypothetical protein O7C98_14695 [Planctomycetota bacterium]|nr:hypothetical protein [Planctomycetota bacterium]
MTRMLLIALLLTPAFAQDARPPDGIVEGELKPKKKTGNALLYAIYLPRSFDPQAPSPLIVAVHGGRGTALQFAKYLRYFAESQGAILACPQAYEEIIGVGADGTWWRGSANEVKALERFVAFVKKEYRIDRDRVTAIGVGDGGQLAARWALSRDRGLQGLVLVNSLWKLSGTMRAKKTTKIYIAASKDGQDKEGPLSVFAARAAQMLRKQRYPLVKKLYPGKSRSFFHGWEEDFGKAYEWFNGKRDWPKELRPKSNLPPPPPGGKKRKKDLPPAPE